MTKSGYSTVLVPRSEMSTINHRCKDIAYFDAGSLEVARAQARRCSWPGSGG